MENHRTDSQYEDALIIKLFVFQFINSYATFFFLAFVAPYLPQPSGTPTAWTGQCGAYDCMQPLSINLAFIFGSQLTVTNFLDVYNPYSNHKRKLAENIKGIPEGKKPTPVEEDFFLEPYDPM